MKKVLLLVLRVLLAGIFVGVLMGLYHLVAHEIIALSTKWMQSNIWAFIGCVVFSLVAYSAIVVINKKYPGYYGSGLPQIEGYYRGWYKFSGLKMLLLLLLNSLFAFYSGFPLGIEGPSISISTSVGMLTNKLFKEEDVELEASAGSAGFACAFAAPLAGIAYLIEENKKLFNLKLIIKGILIIAISFLFSQLVYRHNVLPFFETEMLPIQYYPLLLVVIIFSILISKLYSFTICKIKDNKILKKYMLYITIFLLIVFLIIKRYFSLILGGGSDLISLDLIDYSILALVGMLLFRVFATSISVTSYISGGMVFPLLAIGALVGISLVKAYSFIDENVINYLGIFIIVGMTCVFATTTKCPFTGLVLGLHCGPILVVVIPLILSTIAIILSTKLFKFESIYHLLEKRIAGYPKEENQLEISSINN